MLCEDDETISQDKDAPGFVESEMALARNMIKVCAELQKKVAQQSPVKVIGPPAKKATSDGTPVHMCIQTNQKQLGDEWVYTLKNTCKRVVHYEIVDCGKTAIYS